jgi:hypothetical protein
VSQLQIQETLPVLAFNFEQLKAWASGLTARYNGLVVTEEAIADVKRDMAELNKAKKAVDDARKEAVRRVSEPIRAFEAQVKEVCGIFDDAYGKLSGQVKAHEDAQREAKRKDVEGMIVEANMNAFGEAAFLDIPVQDKWLNKTTSIKSIREDIGAIIERHIEEEQRRKALEQARQDRVAAIESHVHALNQRHELSLPVHRFMFKQYTDLTIPIDAVFADVRAVFEGEARKAAAEGSPHIRPTPTERKPDPAEQAPQKTKSATPASTSVMSVIFEYDPANQARISACLTNLRSLCISFTTRSK